MWRQKLTMQDVLDNGQAVLFAILVHAAIAALLFVGMQWRFESEQPGGVVIQAQVVDVSNMVELMEQRQARERQAAEEAARRERERQAAAERERQEAEQQAAEQQRREQAEQQEREAARQAELERQREAQRRRQEELEAIQREREEARRRAVEAEKQLEAAEERRRQEEAEKQRQAEAQRQRELMEQEAAAQRQQARASQEAEWIGAVKGMVTRSWIRPPTARPGLSCTVSVRAIPGGEVVSASIVEPCNADEATRRSITNAVMSASPLPYRGYENAFQRSFNFRFTYDG